MCQMEQRGYSVRTAKNTCIFCQNPLSCIQSVRLAEKVGNHRGARILRIAGRLGTMFLWYSGGFLHFWTIKRGYSENHQTFIHRRNQR